MDGCVNEMAIAKYKNFGNVFAISTPKKPHKISIFCILAFFFAYALIQLPQGTTVQRTCKDFGLVHKQYYFGFTCTLAIS